MQLKEQLTGTNATLNIILLFLFALGAAFGIGEQPIELLFAAVLPIVAAIREIVKEKRQPVWVGNIATYIFSALALIFPAWEPLFGALPPIIDAIASNAGIGTIIALLFPLINIIMAIIAERKKTAPIA